MATCYTLLYIFPKGLILFKASRFSLLGKGLFKPCFMDFCLVSSSFLE